MTTATTPAKTRKTQVSAAKRSLLIVQEEAAKHLEALTSGQVPEGSFLASALKYDQALTAVRLLDSIGTGPADANGLVEVPRDDVALLIEVILAQVQAAQPGTPLERLIQAVYPDGVPVPAGSQA